MKRTNAIAGYLGIMIFVVVGDLWSKAYFFDLLDVQVLAVDGTSRIVRAITREVIPNWFELEAVLNYGAFSGWFAGMTWMLTAVSVIAVCATTSMVAFPASTRGGLAVALGLVAGGALGNVYDRVTLGAVRDFLKFFYVDGGGKAHVWPNFNVADSAICVGVGWIILMEFFGPKATSPAAGPKENAPGSA
ncbi:MAG: signal peptidase II [Planctomycetota bacterium]